MNKRPGLSKLSSAHSPRTQKRILKTGLTPATPPSWMCISFTDIPVAKCGPISCPAISEGRQFVYPKLLTGKENIRRSSVRGILIDSGDENSSIFAKQISQSRKALFISKLTRNITRIQIHPATTRLINCHPIKYSADNQSEPVWFATITAFADEDSAGSLLPGKQHRSRHHIEKSASKEVFIKTPGQTTRPYAHMYPPLILQLPVPVT
jgi:hypothetical protein